MLNILGDPIEIGHIFGSLYACKADDCNCACPPKPRVLGTAWSV
uniref:Uncharacterized protein n=1 Tax=Arundo donax TaxID=35708 RepID=A0A0A9C910_ARUDO